MSKKSVRRLTTPIGLAVLATLSMTGTAAASDWEWSVTPYAWASDVSADISINDRQVADQEIDFSDLAEDLDLTAQGHFEGRKGRHGVMLDLFYVHLADDAQRFALPTPLPGEALVDGDLKLTILDVGGVFNPRGDG